MLVVVGVHIYHNWYNMRHVYNNVCLFTVMILLLPLSASFSLMILLLSTYMNKNA